MRPTTLAALFALLMSAAAGSATAKVYRFGVVIDAASRSQADSARHRAFEHFVRALSEQLGETVTLEVLQTPGEEAAALAAGRVDMALLKAITYGRAKSLDSEISSLATVISRNDNEEVTTHSGYIISLPTSGIDRVADLKGKRFGFVRDSASGLAYPIAYLARHNLNYRSDFSEHRCYRNHDEMVAALDRGEIDGGTTYRAPHLERNSDLAHVKVIARIKNIPNPLIAVSRSLPDAEKRKLTQALTNLPESAFRGVRFFGLKEIDESFYEPAIRLSALDACR